MSPSLVAASSGCTSCIETKPGPGRRVVLLALLLAAAGLAPGARAATFCVSSASELQTALNTAASNGESDTIRLRRGTYLGSSGPIAFNYTSSENFSLTLEGGWVALTPGGCNLRFEGAEDTVLDSGGDRSVLRLVAGVNSGASFTVRNLTIRNGRGSSGGTDFGGLRVLGLPLLGNITIDRVVFRDNHSDSIGGGLRAQTLGVLRVVNSLFDGNSCNAYYCAADLFASAFAGGAGQPRLAFLGNTVVRTSCAGANCGLGQVNIQTGTDFPSQYLVGNSVFALNNGVDVAFQTPEGTLRNSRWDSRLGTPQSMLSNLAQGAATGFVAPAAGDFRLRPDSGLVDAGFAFAELPEFDLDGADRLAGPHVDIGAYEFQPDLSRVFGNGFEALP
ncbi:MAG: hypothetical protein MEQ07_02705 [Aquimonas sp.]|nr:hypothetical protein [Aquimonas sp.]